AAYTSFAGPPLTYNDDFCNGLGSLISFSVSTGTPYYIQVDGYLGSVGNFTLAWNLTVFPTLTVDGIGNGNGTTTGASPSTISCTSTAGSDTGTCSENVPDGTAVTLTATPSPDSTFVGW